MKADEFEFLPGLLVVGMKESFNLVKHLLIEIFERTNLSVVK